MLIRRWNAGDEFPAHVVDDDGGEWWAGTFQCAAQIVLASAFSASALTAQIANTHYDDLSSASAPAEESEYTPPAPQGVAGPRLAQWGADDDLPVAPVVAAALDDDGYLPRILQARPVWRVSLWDYGASEPFFSTETAGIIGTLHVGPALDGATFTAPALDGRTRTAPALDAPAYIRPG